MKIEYVKGDLFSTEHKFILHGCNNRGVMGSGVAKLIRQKFPYAYEQYMKMEEYPLGQVQVVPCAGKTIINAITQDGYGRDAYRYVSYDAVALVMQSVEEYLYGQTVAMPMIGAGLGGGDWSVIHSIIESELVTVKPVVYWLK